MSDIIIQNLPFKEDQMMTIFGASEPRVNEFMINICPDNSKKDIALYINTRFNKEDSKVICKSRQGDDWSPEITEKIFFNEGEKFKIVIKFTDDWFLVTLTAVDTGKTSNTITFPKHKEIDQCTYYSFKNVCFQSLEIK